MQSERVRIERRRYTWAAFPSRSRTRSRFIVVYVAGEPARINAASPSPSPPRVILLRGAPRCFILRARPPGAFFPVCRACVRSPRNDLASLRKQFRAITAVALACNTGCQMLATAKRRCNKRGILNLDVAATLLLRYFVAASERKIRGRRANGIARLWNANGSEKKKRRGKIKVLDSKLSVYNLQIGTVVCNASKWH